jgi:hypothetical protein
MLIGWSNFFTLTGSAGATLLGLLFVVVTLGTDLSTSRKLDIARASMSPALYSFPQTGIATIMPDEFFNVYDKTGPGYSSYKP